MEVIILGKRSYISQQLYNKIPNCKIFSLEEFLKIYKNTYSKKKIKIIINSFYSAKQLSNIRQYQNFIQKSSLELACFLDLIYEKNIEKIIYTSSSAVYGLDKNDFTFKRRSVRDLYASFKIANEEMLKNFCNKKKIKLIIARVFNIYGEKDTFSIISKLVNKNSRNNKKIQIYNNGNSIRDFIHIDDLIKYYIDLLRSNKSGIYDIGTGFGIKISEIIKEFKLEKKITFAKKKIDEIQVSIASAFLKNQSSDTSKYKKIENFLKKKLKKNKKITLKEYKNTEYKELGVSSNMDVVIYGCGFSGIRIANQIGRSRFPGVRFFVDDNPTKIGKNINGIKIISFSELKEIAVKQKIPSMIVAIPSLSHYENLNLLEKLYPLCLSIHSLPRKKYFKKNNRDIKVNDIEEIPIQEILNRDIFETNPKTLNKFNNKVILITGGAGSIGSEISRQLLKTNTKNVIVLDHSEFGIFKLEKKIQNKRIKFILGDIKDVSFIQNLIKTKKIDYIFHCAAYKHVKFLEENIISAIKNNIFGTWSILKAIENTKINATFISTDKAVQPKNILGITKRIAEILIQFIARSSSYKKCKISVVRFGNVLGSDGSAIPIFIDQIKNNQDVTITDFKMRRFFMTIKEACSLVIEASQIKMNNKIYVLKMGKQIKIVTIIKKIFNLYKKEGQVLKIKKIGNQGNEKIYEKLTISKKTKLTNIKKIFITNETNPSKEVFFNFLKLVSEATEAYQISKLEKLLKNFKW